MKEIKLEVLDIVYTYQSRRTALRSITPTLVDQIRPISTDNIV